MHHLREAYHAGELELGGDIESLKQPGQFAEYVRGFYRKEWVVFSKTSHGSPDSVIEYLGRYTNRVAISNNRIRGLSDGRVSFSWKDNADGGAKKVMTLDACEFIRRFLMHVLPEKFVKIRYYGLLGNRMREKHLGKCRTLLGAVRRESSVDTSSESCRELLLRVRGFDVAKCPFCKKGVFEIIRSLPLPPGNARVYKPP